MTKEFFSGVDKMSTPADSLRAKLPQIEQQHIGEMSAPLTNARNALLEVLPRYLNSRFNFRRVLYGYRAHFKADHGWMAAAEAIGEAIGRDTRTVRRMVAEYERTSGLHPAFAEALEDEHVDPAAPKNAGIVEQVLQMTPPACGEEAARTVAAVVREHRQRRKARKAKTSGKEVPKANGQHDQQHDDMRSVIGQNPDASNGDVKQELEAFAAGLAGQIRQRTLYVPADQRPAEIDLTLVLLGKALGRIVVVNRRKLLPPKPWEQPAA